MKTFITLTILCGLLIAGGYFAYSYLSADSAGAFRTATVKKGKVAPSIPATGTLEPEEVVDVGAQVVGRIKDFGIDPNDPEKKKRIDYDSIVHVDTVLAYIDDLVYSAQVSQAEAALERAEADQAQAEAKLRLAEQDLERSKQLVSLNIPGTSRSIKGITDSEYETSVANERIARANVKVSQAAIKLQEAALTLAKTNLAYTVIKSPVEGEIIDRRVNIGQTVVASLNAPSLFLIAKDLTRMQVWASVNEADIGRIKLNMPVRFTVDALPGEEFSGTVTQIRNNASMTQNVVSYTVIVTTENKERRLRPYLTANMKFQLEEKSDVFSIPNAALRYKPKAEHVAEEHREKIAQASNGAKSGDPSNAKSAKDNKNGGDEGSQKSSRARKQKDDHGRIWIKKGEFLNPVEVKVGITDGAVTEISGEGIEEGMEIVVGEQRKDRGGDDVTNPFAPKMFGGGKRN